jgi:8-oxo-dGTP diphosphatase
MVFMVEKYVVACYGIVLKDGNLLMVQQGKGHWADLWILPGGKLETGESLESCVEREIFEETGCQAKAIRQLATISSYSPDSRFEKQVILIFYLCQHGEGEPAKGDGVNAALWISEEHFARMVVNEVVPRQVFNVVSSICLDASDFPGVFFNFTSPRETPAADKMKEGPQCRSGRT